MAGLIEKSVKIANLPIGTGSALGACIRALYLTATRKISIIGISINQQDNKIKNFTIFDPLDDESTALVSDLVLHLTSEPYHIADFRLSGFKDINAQALSKVQQEDTEPMIGLYSYDVNWSFRSDSDTSKAVISKDDFSNVFTSVQDYHGYKFPNEMVTLSRNAKPLTITLYVSNCRGNFTQSDSSAFLDRYGIVNNVIPVAGCGQRTSNCWFTISNAENAGLETLELHIVGDAACIEDDLKQLQDVCNNYMQLCKISLGNMR